MRNLICLTLLILAGLCSSSSAKADAIIYNGGAPDHNTVYSAEANFSFTMAAESFMLSGASLVTGAQWWGDCSSGCRAATDLTVSFYTNNAGSPGTLIQSYSGGINQSLTGNIIVSGGFEQEEIVYNDSFVGPPLTLQPGSTYWLVIGDDSQNLWGWETTNETGSHEQYCADSGACGIGWNVESDALAFSLTGSAVPEPSSLLLLGTGALGFFGSIRRRLFPRWR